MKNSDAGFWTVMALVLSFVMFGLGKENGTKEAAQQESVRQEVLKTEIQKERLMIQARCNGERVKSDVFAEICRINDRNLGEGW